jgi:Fic family protein
MDNPLGGEWLREKYKLYAYRLTHQSYLGTRPKVEPGENGEVIETYPPHYSPKQDPLAHIVFYLKYDDINLDFLKAVFGYLSLDEVAQFIQQKPKGRYERRIGMLYEFLTSNKLPVPDLGKENYIDLLDTDKYVTGKTVKIARWNLNNNLLGNTDFCPIIRRSKQLENSLQHNFEKLFEDVTNEFPRDIFYRAVNYLYTKETRSSYQIEKEKPSPEREQRFVSLLEKAGQQPIETLLSEKNLTSLQNEIVDPRYAAKGFRIFQNYIGQTTYNFKEIVHYVCPPPEFILSIMNGLAHSAQKSEGVHPIVRATVIAFGFVFAHPFEDGNGRLHRFLIHDVLTRDKLVQKGMIIPVSAHMVDHIKDYDSALEAYSLPLMSRIKYEMKNDNTMVVTNAREVEGYFRYPDLTGQVIYLAKTIRSTITEDIYQEMDFLVKYEEVKTAIQEIVDMPGRNIDMMIKFLHQNRGELAARKRQHFSELTDDEIAKMETAFKEIFNIDTKR